MQPRKNYKNVGMQILVPNNSVEPLNTTFSSAKLSSSFDVSNILSKIFERKHQTSNLEGCSIELKQVAIDRISVISKCGKPLMPCKPAKARKLINSGKAIKKWSKLGIFYIKLNFDPLEPNKNQKVTLSNDPGSQYDGYAVTTKIVNIVGMSELPSLIFPILSKMFERKYQTGIPKKLETRKNMRKSRRHRNTRQRPKRFDNRNKKGFIAPSQKSKVDLRLKIIKELCKLYPVTDFSVEDVKFNHYKKRWGKHFSTVEIGKTMLYVEIQKLGNLHLFNGYETKAERERLNLKKISAKSKRTPESHSTDAIALASLTNKIDTISLYPFYVWKKYQNSRRQLHRLEPDTYGIRSRYGGSNSITPFKKNDVVLYKGKLARIGGFMKNRISLHEYTLENKRFKQSGFVKDCYRLFNQKIMFSFEQKSGVRFLPVMNYGASATTAPLKL